MTLFNISLCLPELDIAALIQAESIAVMTQRFVAPNKSFALIPNCELPTEVAQSAWYRPEVLERLESLDVNQLTHWATCTFSQQITEESAITAIATRTIWTEEALKQFLCTRNSLFLSILRIYKLPAVLSSQESCSAAQLYKFMPLTQYVEVNDPKPLLSDTDFNIAKEDFLAPERPEEESDEPSEDILSSPDWVAKISEFGNSSDGHTFEKLVRKAFTELGFSNSNDVPEASLDPNATGGAGGLDFYADTPYSIVGECKATATEKVKDRPATQLNYLGLKHLPTDEYSRSLKLLIVGGKITSHEDKIAQGQKMNLLRPETLQDLVTLKLKYGSAVELSDLRVYLNRSPFGIAADGKIRSMIQQYEAGMTEERLYRQQRMQIIQTVKELSAQSIHKGKKAFVPTEIRAHHNAKHQPLVTDESTEDMLKELSSPMLGYLARKKLPGDQLRFFFVKDMPAHS